jgi:hypothetical protein
MAASSGAMASAECWPAEQQLADVFLGGGVLRELLVNGQGLGVLMVLFVQSPASSNKASR